MLAASISEQVEEYKVQKCLEGVSPKVGTPWVLKAHASFSGCGLRVMHDTSRLCVVCTTAGSESGSFWSLWTTTSDCLPVCGHCHSIMEQHGLCKGTAMASSQDALAMQEGLRCPACGARDGTVIVTEGASPTDQKSSADHRLQPCRCLVCRKCAERAACSEFAVCPVCESRVQWLADERALLATGWGYVRPRHAGNRNGNCGICVNRVR
eukprot:TRINITY_DN18024_c0_g1_i1.p1 TRINITY_DN18024_c0_g1~~TRINITY_DN18024_c0_g1_i1.p1  ORF type:complete len:230 (-),score=19.94 TRINITY_DN18024_c0_g1_i1:23-652(-)